MFDMKLFTRGAYVTELETRYTVFSRPGKFRVAVWADTYFSGSYREAIDLTLISAGLDPNDAILLTRQARTKYGYYLNFEQALTDDVGIFGRWSWNNGKTEITAFTDIDASLSFGTSIRGTSWGRPDDKIGLAGAINAISRDHRDFLAIGGLGILIGDGQINYRPEKILETFYAYNVNKWSTLTFDYQFIADVAHNADRGPVSVFSARLHAEFCRSGASSSHRTSVCLLARVRVFGNFEPIVAVPDDDRGEDQYVSIGQFDVSDRDASDHGVLQRPNLRHIGMNQKKPGNRKDQPLQR